MAAEDMDYLAMARPGVRGLHPYQPGKPIEELERELGIHDCIKLASNENPLGLSSRARSAIEAALGELTRYPDASGFNLKQKLAAKLGVMPSQITLRNNFV